MVTISTPNKFLIALSFVLVSSSLLRAGAGEPPLSPVCRTPQTAIPFHSPVRVTTPGGAPPEASLLKKLHEAHTSYIRLRGKEDLITYGAVTNDINSILAKAQCLDLDSEVGNSDFCAWYLTKKHLFPPAHNVLSIYIAVLKSQPNNESEAYRKDQKSAAYMEATLHNLTESARYGKALLSSGWGTHLGFT